MIHVQKWKKSKLEYYILKVLTKNIKSKNNIYIGFDYGYFKGVNIYYKNLEYESDANNIKKAFDNEKLFVRLITNFPQSPYDIVILLAYSSMWQEKLHVMTKIAKFKKALSSL